MNCERAQRLISNGMQPGLHSPIRQQLGFHVSDCARCQRSLAKREAAEQHLLRSLLEQDVPAQTAMQAAPRRWRSLQLVALALMGIIGSVIAGWWWWPAPAVSHSIPPLQSTPQPLFTAVAGGIAEPPFAPTIATPTQQEHSPTPTKTPRPTHTATPKPTPQPPQSLTLLLLGLDRRPQETAASRSDAILLLHLDFAAQRAALVSFPRDLWVPLADGSQYVKINAAYLYGETAGSIEAGAELATQTISQLINHPIDHTIVMTFEGLMHTVDIFGGVTIDVPKYIYDPEYPTFDYGYMVAEFVPGVQHMDGATALIYSRTRHADNDFERGKRQQQVLLALVEQFRATIEAGDATTMTVVLRQLYTDAEYTDLGFTEALYIADWIQQNQQISVEQESIDLRFGYQSSTYDGAYIIEPDTAAIQQRLANLLGTEP